VRSLLLLLLPALATAAVPHRSWTSLPSSNGWGAVVVDLGTGRVHHWREHLYATEEPRWNAQGQEVWNGDFPEAVAARDLLGDLDFAVVRDGGATWLADLPVDLGDAGWDGPQGLGGGGTNILRLPRDLPDLRATLFVWAPWELDRAALAAVLVVENVGGSAISGLQIASRHELRLGFGRPGPSQEIGDENELAAWQDGAWEERGFAGAVALRGLDADAHGLSWPGGPRPDVRDLLSLGGVLGDEDGGEVHSGTITALSWSLPTLEPGESVSVGLAATHHGDPFAFETALADLDAWIAARDAGALLDDERALWGDFQDSLTLPPGLDGDEEAVLRQGAVVLRMAQVREDEAFLRDVLGDDATARHHPKETLPATISHRGRGAVLASLPPGQWTYAWPRDGAYAVAGMSALGMLDEAEEGLRFLLEADSGRFADWQELAHYPMVPYQVSLCRHHGFGIEESDTSGGGDLNFEFDGPGLLLWSLGRWVDAGGDIAFVEAHWDTLRERVGGFLVAMQETGGLILPDSSIWEHHWLGKERHWAYTDLVAARGLCDGARLAERVGDAATAQSWRAAAERLRSAIVAELVDGDGVVAATREELALGHGYTDAATLEAAGMALFDPSLRVAPATVDRVLSALRVPGGEGIARNDDNGDAHDLSPWGSSYDSDEWVMMDLRAAVASREVGLPGVSDALLRWVTAQSKENFLAIGETYDSQSADYTNNAPMVGFGPGAYALALFHRAGLATDAPACGAYAAEPPEPMPEETTPAPQVPGPAIEEGPPPGCGGAAAAVLLAWALPLSSGRGRRRDARA
jgi:hypothetical protein